MAIPGWQQVRLWSRRLDPSRVARRLGPTLGRRVSSSPVMGRLIPARTRSKFLADAPILLIHTNAGAEQGGSALVKALDSLRGIPGLRVMITGTMAQDWESVWAAAGVPPGHFSHTVTPLPSVPDDTLHDLAHQASAIMLPSNPDSMTEALCSGPCKGALFVAPNTAEYRVRHRRNAIYYDASSAQSMAFALRRAVETLS